MGSSLSLALQRAHKEIHITAIIRKESLKKEILENGLANEVILESNFKNNWKEFQVVIFGTPVSRISELVSNIQDIGDTIFTDMGSTKRTIIEAVRTNNALQKNYISSHPMCGSEKSGPFFADADLYSGKLVFLTESGSTLYETKETIKEFWESIGSWTLNVSPQVHDEALAYISHLPHILSTILVDLSVKQNSVSEIGQKSTKPITGGGFRDMSRIAGSNPEMWLAIFNENRDFVIQALRDFQNELDFVLHLIQKWDSESKQKLNDYWNNALDRKKEIRKE